MPTDRNHQNNFATNLTSNQIAGVTTTPLNSIPSVAAPFSLAFDATNTNGNYEVVEVTSKTATHVNHAATSYAHTTAEEVRMIWGATELDEISNAINGVAPIKEFAPQGFLQNGKISPTVSSNNLTVAIKTLAGTDPSSSDPVYVRIGDTVRTISAALSVTKNAGTNWCASGDTRYATYERDYFVYLGYNATDGVVIGFSAYPGASQYDDFSATTTNEKYCAISTITTAAATDYYEVIGRFAATLSAGAGYTWTVPTFTSKNLKQYPIRTSRYLSYLPTGPTGATMTGRYMVDETTVDLTIKGAVTGAMNWTTMPALPFAVSANYIANGVDASPSLGVGGYLDSGTANVLDGIRISMLANDTTARFGGANTSAVVSATSPITWANNDTFICRVIYDI